MFEDLIREVRQLERRQTISVRLPEDKEGYVDRQCPNNKCKAEFKVLGKDWDSKLVNKRAYCPVCRNEAPSDDWATPAQVKYVKAVALAQLKAQLHGALESGARQLNRRQHPGFITMSLSVTSDIAPVFLPCAVGEVIAPAIHMRALPMQLFCYRRGLLLPGLRPQFRPDHVRSDHQNGTQHDSRASLYPPGHGRRPRRRT